MTHHEERIVVVGAGAAGLLAAARAAELGARVIVLERNARPGIKLLVSGGGKCNITHAGPMSDVRSAFLAREARWLKPAFHSFTNGDIIRRIEEEGVKTFVRETGRVFPVSGRAGDVVEALLAPLRRHGVEIRLNARVDSVRTLGRRIAEVVIGGDSLPTSHLILATGGASYPKTGTTGDGFRWAGELGHTVIPPRAALAPIVVDPELPRAWRGIALRNGRLCVFAAGRKLVQWDGDILFTHEGLSGPAALEVSRTAAAALEKGTVELVFDFFPGREFPDLDRELLEAARANGAQMLGTILASTLPNRMIPWLVARAGIDPSTRGLALTREQRKSVTGLLKHWTIGRVASVPLERGEVTAGGVDLAEVNPHTMRSRRVDGLYVCGEVLDIAGPVGGYNLQAAFSTGWVAGESAAGDWKRAQELA